MPGRFESVQGASALHVSLPEIVFAVTNSDGSVTNFLDVGAATNFPSRFYRVRLVP